MVYSPRKASYNSSNFHSLSLFATSSSMNVLRCQNSNKTQDNYASIIFSQASCVSLMLFYYACIYSIYIRTALQYMYTACDMRWHTVSRQRNFFSYDIFIHGSKCQFIDGINLNLTHVCVCCEIIFVFTYIALVVFVYKVKQKIIIQ